MSYNKWAKTSKCWILCYHGPSVIVQDYHNCWKHDDGKYATCDKKINAYVDHTYPIDFA